MGSQRVWHDWGTELNWVRQMPEKAPLKGLVIIWHYSDHLVGKGLYSELVQKNNRNFFEHHCCLKWWYELGKIIGLPKMLKERSGTSKGLIGNLKSFKIFKFWSLYTCIWICVFLRKDWESPNLSFISDLKFCTNRMSRPRQRWELLQHWSSSPT